MRFIGYRDASSTTLPKTCHRVHYTELYDDLTTYLQREPLKDPEAWIEKLLRHPKLHCRLAAVRIIEVRDVYASREFDWGETRNIALEEMEACRRTLVAAHLARSAS